MNDLNRNTIIGLINYTILNYEYLLILNEVYNVYYVLVNKK